MHSRTPGFEGSARLSRRSSFQQRNGYALPFWLEEEDEAETDEIEKLKKKQRERQQKQPSTPSSEAETGTVQPAVAPPPAGGLGAQ
ncbi:MAG: hypothetical protein KF854_16495 [Nitrospira sp.]|nr:hypothetical protein [Rhodocyclaceae bacterium]MBX3124693.1 hypothetical protein [Nitrospira sp.]